MEAGFIRGVRMQVGETLSRIISGKCYSAKVVYFTEDGRVTVRSYVSEAPNGCVDEEVATDDLSLVPPRLATS